jgi:hypothetical protein
MVSHILQCIAIAISYDLVLSPTNLTLSIDGSGLLLQRTSHNVLIEKSITLVCSSPAENPPEVP